MKMEKWKQPEKAVVQLGFWSAVIVTIVSVTFPVGLLIGSLQIAYVSSFLLAPAFVALLASIHQYAGPGKKVWSQLGLSFATIYAVLSPVNYYIQLTVIQNNPLRISESVLVPFIFIPGTPLFAQDMLGYAFFCAATLAAGFVFAGDRLENTIKWLFILNGVLFIAPTLILPALDLPTDPAGTGVGDRVGVYANLVWSTYIAITTALVAVFFRRLSAANGSRLSMSGDTG
jgi:hypothetical protein